MKISLMAYAIIKDAFPENPLEFEVPEGTTADQLMTLLAQEFPTVAAIFPYTRLGHQDDYLEKHAPLKEGHEYFLIPPVSGGK